jgi:drug/metabolite transporter (DMT)-like permease
MTALISGFSIFINSFGVKGINSDIFTFSKNIIVALLLLTIIMALGNYSRIKSLSKKDYGWLALIGFVGGSIPFILFYKGLQLTSAAMGSFLQKTMFIFVALMAVYFLKEKLHKAVFLSAVGLLVGNYLILRLQFTSFNLGDLLILMAAMFWAVENTISKHVLKSLDGNIVAFGRMFFGSLFILVYLAFSGELPLLVTITMPQLGWIVVTSVLLLGYVMTWYNGLRDVSVTLATSILLLGSPITTALSLFLGKSLLLSDVIGMIFIVAGVASMHYLEASYGTAAAT